MRKFLGKRARIVIMLVTLGLSAIFAGLIFVVEPNYDMREYLPSDSTTLQSLDILEQEFGEVSMIQIMTTNLEIENAQIVVDELNEIEVVKSVIWLGVIADINIPLESMDQDLIKDYYNNGSLLFTIEFSEDDYSLKVGDAINEIKDILLVHNVNAHYRGPAVSNQSSRSKMLSEMIWIMAVTVPVAILILFLASLSWFEPVLVLLNLGVAIVFNMGTNFLLPSLSYITLAIASVLQLAMSMDYSLFLIHRYYEEREKGLDKVEAALVSLKAAFSSITASALTTIFGFLALVIMRYKIGQDIGLALTKAIVLSYGVTLFFLPILLITFDKVLLKLKHKTFKWNFGKFMHGLKKGRAPIFIALLLVGGVSLYIQNKAEYLYSDSIVKDSSDQLYIDHVALNESFGAFQPIVILYQNEDKSEVIALTNELYNIPEVTMIQSLVTSIDPTIPEALLPIEAINQFKGPNYSRVIVYIDLESESERMYEVSDEIVTLTKTLLPHDAYVIGVPVAISEIKTTVSADGIIVQLVSALLIGLVIGIVLKSAIIPIILVLLIEISIWINIAITSLMGGAIIYIGYLVVSSLQLGATIDYAVLLTGRYQEYRETHDRFESIKIALSKSLPAILTSALVLAAAGFAEALISKLSIVKEIGVLIGRGALLSGFLVIFVLPVLLLIFDKVIQKTIIKKRLIFRRWKRGAKNAQKKNP